MNEATPIGVTQCWEAHEKPLPDFICAHTPSLDLSILQTSPTRSQVNTGSAVVPAGLPFESELGPQASKSPETSTMRSMTEP